MFLHYLEVDDNGEVVLDDEGQPERRMVAPDVYVILGVPNRKRNSYVTWDEGKLPDFILEVLSFSTWRHVSRTDCCASATPKRVATFTTFTAPPRRCEAPKPLDGPRNAAPPRPNSVSQPWKRANAADCPGDCGERK